MTLAWMLPDVTLAISVSTTLPGSSGAIQTVFGSSGAWAPAAPLPEAAFPFAGLLVATGSTCIGSQRTASCRPDLGSDLGRLMIGSVTDSGLPATGPRGTFSPPIVA